MGDGGRARAAAGRGQGECPGTERRGRVAVGGGVGQSGVGPDGVGEGGRRGLRIAETHLPGGSGRRLSGRAGAEPGETSPRG